MKQTIQAATAALLLGMLPAAHAASVLSFSADGGAPITCKDGDACDLNAMEGAVTFLGAVGAFNINVTTGLSKPYLTEGSPLMDLATLNASGPWGAHELVVMFTDTWFDREGRIGIRFGGSLTGGENATFQYSAYYDAGNQQFETTTPIGQTEVFGTVPFSGSIGDGLAPTSPYSVTQVLKLKTDGATALSGNFEVHVPEPATLALLGIALLGFGATRVRRQAR